MADHVTDEQFMKAFDTMLLGELDQNFEHIEARPLGFGITVKEYTAVKRISESTARRHLNDALSLLGWKRKLMYLTDGHPALVYYKP